MTLRNNTDTKSPLTLKNRVFTEKAQELLGYRAKVNLKDYINDFKLKNVSSKSTIPSFN